MTPPDLTTRPTYRPGDRLAAHDLTEWSRAPLAAASRHFVHLHRVYGVARGLTVTVAAGVDERWQATVTAGVAYDPLGRLLTLDQPVSVDVIPVQQLVLRKRSEADSPWAFNPADLSMRSADDPLDPFDVRFALLDWSKLTPKPEVLPHAVGLEASVTQGDCHVVVQRGTVRGPDGKLMGVEKVTSIEVQFPPRLFVIRGAKSEDGEEPEKDPLGVPVPKPHPAELRLIPADELEVWDVPLAGLKWTKGKPEVDATQRATAARGFRRPFIAAGTVPAGTTSVPLTTGTGWRVWVDTTAAGFLPSKPGHPERDEDKNRDTRPPVYLPTIGRPLFEDGAKLVAGKTALAGKTGAIELGTPGLGPVALVTDPRHDGFLLTVLYPPGSNHPDLVGLQATPLDVSWVGVELANDLPPAETPTGRIQTQGTEMGSTDPTLSFRWPEFRDGRRLTADSLNALQQTLEDLGRLHNRALHDWGVADGCGVEPTADRREVAVGTGYALDAAGREVIVATPQKLRVPASAVRAGSADAVAWWVTASYTVGGPDGPDPNGRGEAVPLRYPPGAVVRWRNPRADGADRLRPGLDVILATVTVEQGKVKEVSSAGRRSAVPGHRPFVSAGRNEVNLGGPETTPSGTPRSQAKPWPNAQNPVGVKVKIDTTAGGFVTTPQYLASVEATDATAEYGRPLVLDARPDSFWLVLPQQPAPGGASGRWRRFVPAVVALLILLILLIWAGGFGVSKLHGLGSWPQIAGAGGFWAVVAAAYWASRWYFGWPDRKPWQWLNVFTPSGKGTPALVKGVQALIPHAALAGGAWVIAAFFPEVWCVTTLAPHAALASVTGGAAALVPNWNDLWVAGGLVSLLALWVGGAHGRGKWWIGSVWDFVRWIARLFKKGQPTPVLVSVAWVGIEV